MTYMPDMYNMIVQDIYEELREKGMEPDMEELTENLLQLHEEPINLNETTEDDLKQLRILSAEQIDAILLFVYKQPLHSLYELRLIDELTDYEIRDMLPFVKVESVKKKERLYASEVWHYAHHDAEIRVDARSIEENKNDPIYASVKYKFRYKRLIDAGISAERDPMEPFYYKGKTYGADFYGGWLQMKDMWFFKTIVVGDYRASFGQGLVMNSGLTYDGKAHYLSGKGYYRDGIERKSSTAEYNFLRGIAATIKAGNITEVSVLYSGRKIDGKVENGTFTSVLSTGYHRTENEISSKRAVWQHILGANLTLRLKNARIGVTATENMLSDTLRPRKNYYNFGYFTGTRQASVGINFNWQIKRFSLFGEVAAAQNTTWGAAAIAGIRITPINGLKISTIYRYYSNYYDNMLGSSLSESSRQNNEQGLYVGADITMSRNWRLSAYVDIFRFSMPKYGIRTPSEGFDIYANAHYNVNEHINMQWRLKCKNKGEQGKYSLRYMLSAEVGRWVMKTCIEGNVCTTTDIKPTLGGAVYQQAEYHATAVPIVVHMRLEAFSAEDYANRIYLYENDVLHAFSSPMLYGSGGRWMVNFRYRITNNVSLHLKAAETIFSDGTMSAQSLSTRSRSEVHALLRVKW